MSTTSSNRRWLMSLLAIAVIIAFIAVIIKVAPGNGSDGTVQSTHRAVDESIGQGVTITSQAIPDKLVATPAKKEDLPTTLRNSDADGDGKPIFKQLALLELGPYHGKLQAPMRVTIPLKGLVADKDNTLVVMTRPAGSAVDSWTVLKPIDPAMGKPRQPKTGDTSVTVEMTHLSFLAVFNVFVEAIFKAVAYILESEVFEEAKAPKCPNPDKAKADRYTLRKNGSDALLSCVGYDTKRKKYVLRVVNNRRYLLELSWSHAKVVDDGGSALDLTELYKLRNKGIPVLRPREEALVILDSLKEGDSANVSSALSNWGQNVDMLSRVATALLTVVFGPGAKGVTKTEEVLKFMHESASCNNSINGTNVNLAATLKSCFDEELLKKVFGSALAILLAPLTGFIALLDTARIMANAIGDRRNDRDRSTAVVSRTNQFADFVGKWRHEGGMLQVNADGSGKRVSALDAGAAGACGYIMMMKGGGYCQIYESIVLKSIKNGNTAIGQYTKVYVTKPSKWHGDLTEPYHEYIRDHEGDLVHDDELKRNLPKPGDTFTLRLNKGQRWIEWKGTGDDGIGFKLCDVDSMSYRDVYVCDL